MLLGPLILGFILLLLGAFLFIGDYRKKSFVILRITLMAVLIFFGILLSIIGWFMNLQM